MLQFKQSMQGCEKSDGSRPGERVQEFSNQTSSRELRSFRSGGLALR
jgi:hypothetical protein